MAVDRRTVDTQLKALGDFHQWFAKKEIRHLPSVLNSDETIRAVTSGVYQGSTWLMTVTDQRILFLDKGMFYGVTQVELPLRQINSISYKTGIIYGELHIATSSGGKNTVKKIRKVEVAKLSSIVSSLISKTHSRSTQPSIRHNQWMSRHNWSVWPRWWNEAFSRRRSSPHRKPSCSCD